MPVIHPAAGVLHMKLFPVLLGASVVGVGYLWYRNREAAKATPGDQPSKEDAAGSLACKGLSALLTSVGVPVSPELCKRGLGLGSAALDVVQGLNNNSQQALERHIANDKKNRELNGAVRVPYDDRLLSNRAWGAAGEPDPIAGSVLEFANGCQPFENAPGWSKCAPGTKSMWFYNDNDQVSYKGTTWTPTHIKNAESAFVSLEAREAYLKSGGKRIFDPVARESFRTAATAPRPDPTTKGPRKTATGDLEWAVRGQRVVCSPGKAPRAIVKQALVHDHRVDQSATFAVSTEQDDTVCVAIDDAAGASSPPPRPTSSVSSSPVACLGSSPPAGMTWDVRGYWRRLNVGEKPNPGPCDPNATPAKSTYETLKSKLLDASTLAVVNGAFASRQ